MNERGQIVAIGGAEERSPDGIILHRFVRLCGGHRARIAIIPTASQLEETGPSYESVFTKLGARRARALPFEVRADCDSDEYLEELERADGVFFTGGNQLRLSKILGGTQVAELLRRRHMEDRLHVGGTSAGAAILSEHMIAYGDEGMAPRAGVATLAPGLGFLPEAIVDQHFSQRNRLGRLLLALAYNPRLIGVGIDEDTAAFLQADLRLEVVGSGLVTIADASEVDHSSIDEASPGEPIALGNLRLHLLRHGDGFDLSSRTLAVEGHDPAVARLELAP